MAITAGITIGWPGTVASIPANWIRESGLDSKFIRGAPAGGNSDLVTSFGSGTHTHTSPSHTPLVNGAQHLHAMTGGAATGNITGSTGGTTTSMASTTHTHGAANSYNSAGIVNSGTEITVDANSSNDLAHVKVVWIKSNGTPNAIPVSGHGFFASDSLPNGWARTYGDQYLKGADIDSNGGTFAGNNWHSHTSPYHTHGQSAHTHSGLTANNTGAATRTSGSTGPGAKSTHKHSYTLDSATGVNSSGQVIIGSGLHEPPYKKLNFIYNGNVVEHLPTNFIALWSGTHAGIPASWIRYSGMDDSFIKTANTNGESTITTGGSSTHTHDTSGCLPTQAVHTHTATVSTANTTYYVAASATTTSNSTHTHSWTIGDGTIVNLQTTVTVDANSAESAYPAFAKVIFIQYTGSEVVGGGGPSPPRTSDFFHMF